jgi:hypothetical protein
MFTSGKSEENPMHPVPLKISEVTQIEPAPHSSESMLERK